ncbi:MAG: 6-carboxytetrahydropterin synthase QueD [Defluviitaleaceae bacterium]|nr:6-carboxytetrahydropterin synthase QueD [Defluviitaleaceae bacterium]
MNLENNTTIIQKIGEHITYKDLKYHNNRVLVSKEFTFDSAHHLHCYEGVCKNLHGHTYRLIIGISGFINDIGMTLDFEEIKKIWDNEIKIHLDHRYLNESLPLMNTTAENMVVWIFEKIEVSLSEKILSNNEQNLRVEFVRLFETPSSYAEIKREWIINE